MNKAPPEPTIIPLDLPPLNYALSFGEMRDAGQYYHTNIHFEEYARHYCYSWRDAKRELFLVCFHREIGDSQNPAESELLRELDEIGLQPEGIFELLAVGKHLPGLQRLLHIYARGSDWRNPSGTIVCASLGTDMHGRFVGLDEIGRSRWRWIDKVCFIVSRKPKYPEPTIIPITFARNYGQTLVQARDSMQLDGYVGYQMNDKNFPPEGRTEEREFVLVCFNRKISDNDGPPEGSELLQELDKLGLEPEGPMELCFLGADERTRGLQREHCIVARRQTWRNPVGWIDCPILESRDTERFLRISGVPSWWHHSFSFLASRKPSSK